ncbi:MAG TPA: putative monovalent cation/H+ antiporter subunit A [Planctomycetaceae bacterium]|nr:putative monovalent cation/H+ antiporter subunit A [Planctomycetaceae bacterium]
MLWILLTLLIATAVAPGLHRVARHQTGWLLALLPVGVIAWSSQFWRAIAAGSQFHESYPWVPSLGVNAAFRLDGLSLIFLLLICGIGALVFIYASEYLRDDRKLGLFYTYLLLFMTAMLGLVLADNVFLLFVFWELTSISSFLLIGWNHSSEESRDSARTALIVTGGGGLMLLAGVVLLRLISGSSDLSTMSGDVIRESPLYLMTLLLVLGGALTKSAQFPFHFWLPGAMAAPTPVSAYLHSATMVKAGIYLLARVHPILGSTSVWFTILTLVGGTTMLVGAVIAVTQTDLKRILAYSTVSVLGTLTMLLGIGTSEAVTAAMVYVVAHSLYKGALFLIAGSVDHETGTRDITQLQGLAKPMPLTATSAVLVAASSAGVPPLFGFVSKELFYEAAWHAPGPRFVALTAAFLASALLAVVALMVAYRPFFGRPVLAPQEPHEAPWRMGLGPMTLALASLIIGLYPASISDLLGAAASATHGSPVSLKLKLWHGFTPVLGLSAITLAAGPAVYFLLRRCGMPNRHHVTLVSFQSLYDHAYTGMMAFAEWLTGIVQNGYLRSYVMTVIITLLVLLARPLLQDTQLFEGALSEIHLPELILAVVILVAALAITLIDSRLAVAAVLGTIGIAVMLLYVIFGAVDLAVTQIMVETLTVIVLVLVLYHLPKFLTHSSRWIYVRDGVVSLAFGGMIALLVITAFATPADPELREFYAAQSFLAAHGRNVVNVILVDFRATDTMGEVTVLTVAAIGVHALLRFHAERKPGGGAMVSLVLRTATPVLMLLLLVVSLFALLRGHHESGGGFVGGLLAAAAFSLHALAHDVRSTRLLLGVPPQIFMGAGLILVVISGLSGLITGGSFMQGQWTEVFLPGLGDTHLGTPLLFDVGVYAVVMGMVLTIVLTAAEE